MWKVMIAGLSLLHLLNVASFRLHLVISFNTRREVRREDPTQTRGKAVLGHPWQPHADQEPTGITHVVFVQCTSAYMRTWPHVKRISCPLC